MSVINQSIFEKFIGIDWSGAKYSKNLRVAVCEPGKLVPKPEGEHWRRDELVNWIIKEANQRRILVGADFAFAYPYCDKSTYFPGLAESPESSLALWQRIDSICQDERHFYAGPFYKDRATPFSDYFCYQDGARPHYVKNRLRRTDKVCAAFYTQPTCVFKCVGPDQVGSGSTAGMRALHFLATNHAHTMSIWPFYSISKNKSVLVEIFPRLFFARAREDSRQWRDLSTVNAVLRHFKSEPLEQGFDFSSKYAEDKIDAIVSAAALRGLSSHPKVWHPQSLEGKAQRFEGWIFGCTQ